MMSSTNPTRSAAALTATLCLLGASFVNAANIEAPGATQAAAAAVAKDSPRWTALRKLLFEEREILDGTGLVNLDAPYRAHDGSTVPIAISIQQPQSEARFVKTVTLVIDENPAPIAGRFHFTPASGNASLETRVRVNAYSSVRAVAELNTGELFIASRYVKASGGCSAPAVKDPQAALARLGKIKLRQSAALEPGKPSRALLMISHPNSTGMQMDQVTQHYIPAHFVKNIDVTYGGDRVLSVESDISLSEDPNILFHFMPRAGAALEVKVRDTDDNVFEKALDVPSPAS